MILVELTPVPLALLPVAEFRDHLRLGTGFADDAVQDAVLESTLRAALAAIESRTGKAIFARAFRWQQTSWRGFQKEELPVAPVTAISSVTVVEADGSETPMPAGSYSLVQDAHRPILAATGFGLPTVPVGGRIEIELTAGYASVWSGIPADLRQAVLLLAADFHENRHDGSGQVQMPTRVHALLAPYRQMRLFGRRS